MPTTCRSLLPALLLLCSACARLPQTPFMEGLAGIHAAPAMRASAESSDRKIIWSGSLAIEVPDLSNAIVRLSALAEAERGHIESMRGGEQEAWLTLRLPANRLQGAVEAIAQIGRVTYRDLANTDVTEEYVDIEARRGNLVALRDRLRALLDRATEVKDVVAIEAELSRVQSELDSLDARMKALQGQIDLATLHVHLTRKPILGPLGYAAKGLWWMIEKLFVIRR